MNTLRDVFFLAERQGYPNKKNNLLLKLYIVLKRLVFVAVRSGLVIAISKKTDYPLHLPTTTTYLIGLASGHVPLWWSQWHFDRH